MVIGIDLISLSSKSRYQGIFSYSIGLVDGLLKQKKYKVIIFCNKLVLDTLKKNIHHNFDYVIIENKKTFIHKLTNFILVCCGYLSIYPYRLYKIANDFFFKDVKKKLEKNCNILINPLVHLTVYNLKIPTILNMHDIMQIDFPNFFTKYQKFERNLSYNNSALHCSRLVASSKFMFNKFNKYFKLKSKNKVSLIEEGVSLSEKKIKFIPKLTKKLPKSFLFYPAQLWPHKNHLFLIKAIARFNKIYNYDIKLVLTGGKKNFHQNLKKIFIKNKSFVTYLGPVSRRFLCNIYHRSKAVIIPSLYESSSLVLYESIYFKKNIILSDIKPFLEKKKQFKMFFFINNNENNLVEVLHNFFIKNKKLSPNDIKFNYTKLKSNDWETIAKKYIILIKNLL